MTGRTTEKKARKHLERIAALLGDGYTVTKPGDHIKHNDDWILQISETHHSWSHEPTGKLYITIGNYGNKKRFNERKDGTFRDELIPFAKRYAEGLTSSHNRALIREKAQDKARDKLAEHGIRRFGYIGKIKVVYTTIGEQPAVKFEFKAPLDKVDQLIEVLGEILNDD